MKITRGPMLEKYARYFNVPIDEVVEWVNAYVNHPGDFHNPELIEKTEAERMQSIKGYITMRINDTSNERIRASIAAEKLEAA